MKSAVGSRKALLGLPKQSPSFLTGSARSDIPGYKDKGQKYWQKEPGKSSGPDRDRKATQNTLMCLLSAVAAGLGYFKQRGTHGPEIVDSALLET